MDREEAIEKAYRDGNLTLENIYQLIREAFTEGASVGLRWGKQKESNVGPTLTGPKIGEALDEWCGSPVPGTYLSQSN